MALWILFAVLLCITIALVVVIVAYRRAGGDVKLLRARVLERFGIVPVDIELATLRELPRTGVHLPNAIYALKYEPDHSLSHICTCSVL